jgi:hypothetical protein
MFALTKLINVPIFIASLAFGIFAVYITIPLEKKIYVYPTPENIDILLYRDKANNCFQFKQEEVGCPRNPEDIAKIPTQ